MQWDGNERMEEIEKWQLKLWARWLHQGRLMRSVKVRLLVVVLATVCKRTMIILSSLPVGVDATESRASTAASFKNANLIVSTVVRRWGRRRRRWNGCRGSRFVWRNARGRCGRSHILDATVSLIAEIGNATASWGWLAAASRRGHSRRWVASCRVTASTWRLGAAITTATTAKRHTTAEASASTWVSTAETRSSWTTVASTVARFALCDDLMVKD